jgi:type IV pilus assembly protein PilV
MAMSRNKNTSGFTLIEVLIAVVILSIGLLGMAGIQLQGLRGTTSSNLRSDATILANDIAERIHANVNGVSVGAAQNLEYANVDTAGINCANQPNTICSDTPNSAGVAACNAAGGANSMAAYDIFEFACGPTGTGGVKNLLPTGSATINCAAPCAFGSPLTINVNWSEVNPQGTALNKTVTMVVVP